MEERSLLAADIHIDSTWLSQHGPAPYLLTSSDTRYVLDTDITVDGTAGMVELK